MEFCSSNDLASLGKDLWIIFPDDKELELTLENFPGKKFNQATLTTIDAAARKNGSGERAFQENFFSGKWFSSGLKKVTQPEAESEAEAGASEAPPDVLFVVQPGDGGPMEDWLNVELMSGQGESTLVVLNGQLDRLRDGYYPPLIFPKVAQCTDRFYRKFEPILYLKPLLDKGFSGWLYRVYPEPWQVIIQQKEDGETGTVVASLDERPSYNEAVALMKATGFSRLG